MIAYILYNKHTQSERVSAVLCERLEHEQIGSEMVDADSPRGVQLAENYDILGRPAIILVKTDGAPIKIWQGEDSWPAVSEVAYLARQ